MRGPFLRARDIGCLHQRQTVARHGATFLNELSHTLLARPNSFVNRSGSDAYADTVPCS
jgi:hypothetical protein